MGKYFSENIFRNLFILWFLLFPFDAHLFPLSIGFMTIYPSLFLLFFLLCYSFLGKQQEVFAKADVFVIIFFFLWVVYGLAFLPFVNDKKIAIYELRSLVLMAVTIWLLFRVKYLIGIKLLFEMLYRLSVFLFLFLTAFAFFEFFTGIHFAGKFTEKLWNLPAGMPTYSPVFLFDNPNTFLCYLFGIALIVFISGRKGFHSYKYFSIIFILFFFSVVSDSKFGKISVYILLAVWLVNFLNNRNFLLFKKYLWWSFVSIIGLVFCFATKEIYLGPMWKDGEHYLIPSINPEKVEDGKPYFYSSDSLVKQFGEKEVIASFREYQMRGTDWAVNIRKNLLLNGWYLTKQSKFMGVGPAQFMWYHSQKQAPYPTTTVTNPHNYAMEILSQYGLAIFIPFILLFIFSWIFAFRKRNNNIQYFYLFSVCCVVFILISNMPSSFLILNIGWVLIPVFLIAPVQLEEKNA